MSKGFTIIEILVVIVVGAGLLTLMGSGLNLLLRTRDTSLVSRDIAQSARQIYAPFSRSNQKATRFDVTSGGSELQVTGDPCMLFRYDSGAQVLRYAETSTQPCTPPTTPTTVLNDSSARVTQLQFVPLPQASNARTIQINYTISATRPFTSSSQSFTSSVTLWNP